MELVGQAVPHRHIGVFGQFLDDLLPEAPVLDAFKHAGKHLGGISNGFLLADLAARGVQVGGTHAQIMGGDLKGAAGAGGGLFKNQRHIFATQYIVRDARLLFGFQLGGQVQQPANLLRRIVQQRQKITSLQIHNNKPPLGCIKIQYYSFIIARFAPLCNPRFFMV